jgi:hypothetical protein
MCAAIFSASGKEFDASGFLAGSALQDDADAWKAGTGRHKDSGFQVIVRDDPDLKNQISGVVEFIHRFLPELKRLRVFNGVEAVDFRVAYFWSEEVAALAYELPEELHVALAQIPATLTFCVYPCSKAEPNQPPEPILQVRDGSS